VPTPAAIQASIDALEAKIAQFAGVRSSRFSDQATEFSLDDAHKELARLRGELAAAASSPRIRYVATDKGC
jgi:hypothetical protein